MKRTLALALTWSLTLAAMAATSPAPSKAAGGSKPPPPSSASRPARDGSRFLFVVDTSSSMKGIDPATRQALFELIYSGIDGYMRDGDTFGLWTFDEEVGTGKFPMQVWSPQKPLEGASRAATFVRGQEYKGHNRMDDLTQKLTAVIRAVTNVNVFLITDGEARLEGTPVDEAVNAAFARRARERKIAKKPFVATLVAQAGKIVRGTVTLPGEPISLPPRPEPQKRAEKPATPTMTNALTTAPATPPVPDTAKEKTAQSASSAAAEKSPPSRHAESGETTTLSVAATTADSSQNRLINEASPAEPTATGAPAAKPGKVMQIITKPAHTPEPEPAKEIAGSAETNAALQQVAALVAPPVTVVTSTPVAAPAPAPPAPVAAPPAEPPAASPPAIAIATTEEQDAAIQPVPRGLLVAAREPASATTPANAAAPPTGLAAMRVESGLGAIPTLIIGGILLAMSLFLLGIALRRMRPEGQSSLITQSMHRR